MGPIGVTKQEEYYVWNRGILGLARARCNTVHLSTLMAFLMSIGGSGLFVCRRSGKLLILRLTPR
jgi:hypothetical protein